MQVYTKNGLSWIQKRLAGVETSDLLGVLADTFRISSAQILHFTYQPCKYLDGTSLEYRRIRSAYARTALALRTATRSWRALRSFPEGAQVEHSLL